MATLVPLTSHGSSDRMAGGSRAGSLGARRQQACSLRDDSSPETHGRRAERELRGGGEGGSAERVGGWGPLERCDAPWRRRLGSGACLRALAGAGVEVDGREMGSWLAGTSCRPSPRDALWTQDGRFSASPCRGEALWSLPFDRRHAHERPSAPAETRGGGRGAEERARGRRAARNSCWRLRARRSPGLFPRSNGGKRTPSRGFLPPRSPPSPSPSPPSSSPPLPN